MGNSLQTADRGLDPLGDPLVVLGLKADPDREIIEYGPRAPLVVPASTELPPPQQRVADHGLDWPDDPDVRARREYEEARRVAQERGPTEVEEASRTLSRAELDEWGRRFGRVSTNQQPGQGREASQAVSPEELRGRTVDPDSVALVEPPRRRLTEPPAGYRHRTDTEDEPAAEEESRGFFSRVFSGRSGAPPDRGSQDPRFDPANRP